MVELGRVLTSLEISGKSLEIIGNFGKVGTFPVAVLTGNWMTFFTCKRQRTIV